MQTCLGGHYSAYHNRVMSYYRCLCCCCITYSNLLVGFVPKATFYWLLRPRWPYKYGGHIKFQSTLAFRIRLIICWQTCNRRIKPSQDMGFGETTRIRSSVVNVNSFWTSCTQPKSDAELPLSRRWLCPPSFTRTQNPNAQKSTVPHQSTPEILDPPYPHILSNVYAYPFSAILPTYLPTAHRTVSVERWMRMMTVTGLRLFLFYFLSRQEMGNSKDRE